MIFAQISIACRSLSHCLNLLFYYLAFYAQAYLANLWTMVSEHWIRGVLKRFLWIAAMLIRPISNDSAYCIVTNPFQFLCTEFIINLFSRHDISICHITCRFFLTCITINCPLVKSPRNFLADAVGDDNSLYSFLSIIADRLPRRWEIRLLNTRIVLVFPVEGELLCHARVRAGNCQRIN
ncbi:hypothetical protein BV53_01280, partial [Candidatus Synechococcus spongiarum LMB bulk15N]